MKNSLTVNASNGSYPIYLESDFSQLCECFLALPSRYGKVLLVTDSNVAPLYLEEAAEALKDCGAAVYRYILPAGEENKTLSHITDLYRFLIENSFDRKDCLAALGGGVIGDMTGFAAATYLRGIDFIQIPTSLLAQVDSSIGGKCGVDFESYKNMVGAFKQPKMVYMSMHVLKTLPARQFSTGMAEILKHGLIRSKDFLDELATSRDQILAQDPERLLSMIRTSCEIKRDVVEEDPYEKGVRAILNYGHTIGHALEKESHFELTHGEAVSLGCIAASWISCERGLISESELIRIEELFSSYHLPVRYTDFDIDAVLENCRHDKKAVGNTIRFILLKKMGEAFIDPTVSCNSMVSACQYLKGKGFESL